MNAWLRSVKPSQACCLRFRSLECEIAQCDFVKQRFKPMSPTEATCVQIHSHASQLNCSQNVPLSDLMHISGETMWPESSCSSFEVLARKIIWNLL